MKVELKKALQDFKDRQGRMEITDCPRCGRKVQNVWVPSQTIDCFVCEVCAGEEITEIVMPSTKKPIAEWVFVKKLFETAGC